MFRVRCLVVTVCLLVMQHMAQASDRPNVLFIAVDDLNDWITLLDAEAPIRTPNLKRLADRGMLFTRAYCSSPACNPSRVSVLTGLRPSTSGVYGNKADWRGALPDVVTLPAYFKQRGYRVEGAGKIFHHHYGSAFHDDQAFHRFQKMPDPPDAQMPDSKLNGLPWYGSPNTDWGRWPTNEQESVDVRTVDFAVERLKHHSDSAHREAQPLFLAVGVFRPHMPFFAPAKYFESYPIEQTVMPAINAVDRSDLPGGANALLKPKNWFFEGMMKAESSKSGTWRDAVRAYQACVSFADTQIGRLLDAVDACELSDNTVIMLWSDHGYHLGEKRHWEKFALWEKTTHVPFIVVAPGQGQPGRRCKHPVDLTTIYPTLVELCGLPEPDGLDGVSVTSLLRDPDQPWKRPAVMTYQPGNHAVRTDRWRYIRYADGSEELYDHTLDRHEWYNLASHSERRQLMDSLAKWLPQSEAEPVRNMKPPGR